jgi:hypothetical protein
MEGKWALLKVIENCPVLVAGLGTPSITILRSVRHKVDRESGGVKNTTEIQDQPPAQVSVPTTPTPL